MPVYEKSSNLSSESHTIIPRAAPHIVEIQNSFLFPQVPISFFFYHAFVPRRVAKIVFTLKVPVFLKLEKE